MLREGIHERQQNSLLKGRLGPSALKLLLAVPDYSNVMEPFVKLTVLEGRSIRIRQRPPGYLFRESLSEFQHLRNLGEYGHLLLVVVEHVLSLPCVFFPLRSEIVLKCLKNCV